MDFKIKAIIVLAIICISAVFLLGGDISINIVKEIPNSALGASDVVGEYAVETTNNWDVITYVPTILHKIIIGTANDSVYVADGTTTPTDNKAFQITATVPGTFDIEAIFSQGLVANVSSTNGVIFITSPY